MRVFVRTFSLANNFYILFPFLLPFFSLFVSYSFISLVFFLFLCFLFFCSPFFYLFLFFFCSPFFFLFFLLFFCFFSAFFRPFLPANPRKPIETQNKAMTSDAFNCNDPNLFFNNLFFFSFFFQVSLLCLREIKREMMKKQSKKQKNRKKREKKAEEKNWSEFFFQSRKEKALPRRIKLRAGMEQFII